MHRIKNIIAAPGLSGFYFDDLAAIRNNVRHNGFTYNGRPLTEGFSAVRQAGEAVSIMIVLDDDQVATGDCVAVQYPGAGGRDGVFSAEQFMLLIEREIAPILIGAKLDNFKKLATRVDTLRSGEGRLHTALRYGLTQSLLGAVAKARGITRTEVVAEDYNLSLELKPVPIFAQTGDRRYLNADKCIIKRVDVFPHALINNVDKLGRRGEKLLKYVKWLKERVKLLGGDDYRPVFHIDTYGTIGIAFDRDPEKMASYLGELQAAAAPFSLRIEGPLEAESRKLQIKEMRGLCELLADKKINVELVADEWCNTFQDIREFVEWKAGDMVQIKTPDLGGINNTIEAVLYCRKNGMGAYLGGSCNETDQSARVCADIALAVRPDQILAKPGMDVDVGLMIVKNEMQRVLARISRLF